MFDIVEKRAKKSTRVAVATVQPPIKRFAELRRDSLITVEQTFRLKSQPKAALLRETPTAHQVVANYTRGLVLYGRKYTRMAPFEWRSFPTRAIITPETAKVPKRLRSVQRKTELEIKLDHDFEEIILACQRGESDFVWLTLPLIDVYREVHRHGFVATVGTYRDGQLVGGLWGITVGRTFGVMSIFHRENNAGALAMAAVSDIILSDGRWSVVDCGGINSNFERYGATEIPLEQFCEVVWQTLKVPTSHDHVLQ